MEAFGDIQKKMSSPLLSIPSTLRNRPHILGRGRGQMYESFMEER